MPPHAALELGLVYRKLDDFEESRFWLNKAIYDYSNYMNATTVHIRAHTALTVMRASEEAANPSTSIDQQYQDFEDKLRQMNKEAAQKNGAAFGLDGSAPMEALDKALEVEDLS